MTQLSPEVTHNFRDDSLHDYSDTYLESLVESPVLTEQEIAALEAHEQSVQIELSSVDGWMNMRVRNELVKQIYLAAGTPGWHCDEAQVQFVLMNELNAEKEKYAWDAKRMRVEQRVALKRVEDDPQGPTYYRARDADKLKAREETYGDVADRLEEVLSSDNEARAELTEAYIEKCIAAALCEVIEALAQQKRDPKNEIGKFALRLHGRNAESQGENVSEPVTLQTLSDSLKIKV